MIHNVAKRDSSLVLSWLNPADCYRHTKTWPYYTMWNNHKLHTNDKGSYIYNNAITLKLSQFMVLFPAFHGVMELEARVNGPVCFTVQSKSWRYGVWTGYKIDFRWHRDLRTMPKQYYIQYSKHCCFVHPHTTIVLRHRYEIERIQCTIIDHCQHAEVRIIHVCKCTVMMWYC